MITDLIIPILISILTCTGILIIYKMTQTQANAHKGYEALALQLQANYTQNSYELPLPLTGSVLAHSEGVFSDIITGTMNNVPFMAANAVLGEPSQISEINYTVAAIQTAVSFPHLLIVPDSIEFMYSPLELRNEHNLRPAELEGDGIKVYVASGYELEALQILQPSTLESLKGLRSVIEASGNSLIVVRRHYANPQQYLEIVTEALTVATSIKGLDKAIAPIGDLPQTLHLSTTGRLTVGFTRLVFIFIGSLTAIAVLTFAIVVLIGLFKK